LQKDKQFQVRMLNQLPWCGPKAISLASHNLHRKINKSESEAASTQIVYYQPLLANLLKQHSIAISNCP